jgi:hypothetical protein
VALESVEIIYPSCFHTFEIRRDPVEALDFHNKDENSVDVPVQAAQG